MEMIKETVIKKDSTTRRMFALFLCPICLNEVEKPKPAGIRQKTCGCKSKGFQHGDATRKNKKILYSIWERMKERCRNKNEKSYVNNIRKKRKWK